MFLQIHDYSTGCRVQDIFPKSTDLGRTNSL